MEIDEKVKNKPTPPPLLSPKPTPSPSTISNSNQTPKKIIKKIQLEEDVEMEPINNNRNYNNNKPPTPNGKTESNGKVEVTSPKPTTTTTSTPNKTEGNSKVEVTSPKTTTTTTTTTSNTPNKTQSNGKPSLPTTTINKKPVAKKLIPPVDNSSSSDSSDSSDSDSDSDSSSLSDSSELSSSSDSDAPKKKKLATSVKPTPTKKVPTKTTTTTTTTTTSSSKGKKKLVKKEPVSSSEDESNSDSDSSESDSSEDEKKPKKPTNGTSKKKAAAKSKTTTTKTTVVKKESKKRKIPKGDEEEEEDEGDQEEEYRWWEEAESKDGKKWKTLQHNGPIFPPAYEPHGIKLYYDKKPVTLTVIQEEAATFYAQYLETDHVKKEVFRKNFFSDFRKLLDSKQKELIKSMDLCDFSKINEHLREKKEQRKNRTKEEKNIEKKEKEALQKKYGFALVDGHKQKVGNFMVEPPGLFLGRGAHPKTGMMKRRISPSDVTINIGKNADVPPCPVPGQTWKHVQHDNKVTWLAFWRETINDGFKYVWLAPSSKIKGQADRKKFETARLLKESIDDIRKNYKDGFKSKDKPKQQLSVALYLIDFLALRVGNEKGDDVADTVGCCSLRVEHLTFENSDTITLDFLGKDSMRYLNTVKIDSKAYKLLKEFTKGKEDDDDIFDQINSTGLNTHLKKQMKGLSAKVFRTYNASITLQKELAKMNEDDFSTIEEKVLFYNRCNKEVAILCNHQRAPPKNFNETITKIDDKVEELQDLIKLCQHKIKEKSVSSAEMKAIATRDANRLKDLIASNIEKKKDISKFKDLTDKEISTQTKEAFDKTRNLPDTDAKLEDKIEKLKSQIKKKEVERTGRDELKTIALGTSKINYLDPRITVAWCKKYGVPVEKIFSKSLREKFPWSDVDDDYEF